MSYFMPRRGVGGLGAMSVSRGGRGYLGRTINCPPPLRYTPSVFGPGKCCLYKTGAKQPFSCMSLSGFGAFGQINFNSASVWSDWQAGGSRGNDAAKAIQAALNQIGYGPIAVDGQFGKGSVDAWNRFASANGVPTDWPTQVGIDKLGEQLNVGGDQGGGGVVESHLVGGQYVPGAAPGSGSAKASTGLYVGIGLAAVAALGLIALIAKKKKTGPQSGTKRVETTLRAA